MQQNNFSQVNQAQKGYDMPVGGRYSAPNSGSFSGGSSNGQYRQQGNVAGPSYAGPTNSGTLVGNAKPSWQAPPAPIGSYQNDPGGYTGNTGITGGFKGPEIRPQQSPWASNGNMQQQMDSIRQKMGGNTGITGGMDFSSGPQLSPQDSRAIARPQETPQQFISNWQNSHPIAQGMGSLVGDMQAAGYNNVSPYMYGNTPSGNELNLGGEKFKVMGAEGTPNQYWYKPGMDDSAPQGMGPQNMQGIIQMLQQLMGGGHQFAGSAPQSMNQQMKPGMNTSLAPVNSAYAPQSNQQGMDVSSFLGNRNRMM